jgi:hypothetical protein
MHKNNDGMAILDPSALAMAIQAVDQVIGELQELMDEGGSTVDEQVLLEDFRNSADEMKRAYLEVTKIVINLSPYEDLVKNYRR